jgi:hypothetical protein
MIEGALDLEPDPYLSLINPDPDPGGPKTYADPQTEKCVTNAIP